MINFENYRNPELDRIKTLSVGDRLYSDGSWNTQIVTIVSISESEAIADNGYIFDLVFHNGSNRKSNKSGFLDFNHWLILDSK